MDTGDATYIKQINRRILIEEIIKNISLSRSELSRITGLNKATVSAQVSDLLNDHIVIEKSAGESITRGRKPILLEINGEAGYSIGIDIDEHVLNLICINLKGKPFHKLRLDVENYNFDHVINLLIENVVSLMEKFNQAYQPIGLVGVGVGIHGIVNNKSDIVFTPKQQWSNIDIQSRLENTFKTNVYVDNNANLSAYAEQVYYEHISDLFCITLYSGIGLGMINENKIYRGFQGFAGEIGHMIVEPNGLLCSCGNKGCWELYASETSLMNTLEEKYPTLTLPEYTEKLVNEEAFEAILDEYLNYLAIGLNNIINIFNPETIIINGTIINGHSSFITNIREKLKSKINNYRDIRVSQIGENACALGGAALAIKNFFGVNMVDYVDYNYFN
ncbi:ROK family transcriptional regulator [Tuberibacillus sp. Marseille-P3662]|uniref:ROK family transcriptional regulator n=1 Tax=Tuberibacillus sp. Marseille-P3662 TaxID=1965358 RepID=UPI001592F55A|nr:ROK family transcriptional regulator [Tuberibacillus sp. Marseille-P3662]